MKTRKDILLDLINLRFPTMDVLRNLHKYKWDSEELVSLTREIACDVLSRFISMIISSKGLVVWADAIESREDIVYDNDIKEMLFEISNPEINGEITEGRAKYWLDRLK